MATKKKIVKVGGDAEPTKSDYQFKPSDENKSKATTFRVIAFVGWILAIGLEVFAIFKLLNPLNMTWLIVVVVIALALAITGNLLWKKATRLDPASEKNKFKFFMNNQLGAIMSALAFLPLLIMVLTNKDMTGKQKGIIGAIVGVALLAAVGTGVDANAPSVEQYTEETRRIEDLTGSNEVYWTKYGKKYHIFDGCQHINGDDTEQINSGTVAQAYEGKNISELCKTCANKAEKEKSAVIEDATDAFVIEEEAVE
ncbi:MAG: hypothetical protein AB8B72_09200 [Crocinitomicaceae bacterium]